MFRGRGSGSVYLLGENWYVLLTMYKSTSILTTYETSIREIHHSPIIQFSVGDYTIYTGMPNFSHLYTTPLKSTQLEPNSEVLSTSQPLPPSSSTPSTLWLSHFAISRAVKIRNISCSNSWLVARKIQNLKYYLLPYPNAEHTLSTNLLLSSRILIFPILRPPTIHPSHH